jgi:thiamine-phosphate pyrophosphorylase
MLSKRLFDLSDVHLYCVTSPPKDGRDLRDAVESALKGGADAVQLARDLKVLCDRAGALFFVNDRVDVAAAADADGVHIGQEDAPVCEARKLLGHKKLVGVSCHSVGQALVAEGQGADYVSCGPLFITPTKPGRPATGLGLIGEYRKVVRAPFVAIGGVDETNVERVVRTGADRVAVVRAVFDAPDPEAASRKLKDLIFRAKAER